MKSKRKFWPDGLWQTHLQGWLACFAVAWAVTTFGVSVVGVGGSSMMPNVRPGERVLVLKWQSWLSRMGLRDFQRGDIVGFEPPLTLPALLECEGWFCTRTHLIKRVVGVPGDTVTLKGGRVFVNGKLYQEGNIWPFWEKSGCHETQGEEVNLAMHNPEKVQVLRVPPGHYYLLGDNRAPGGSIDSRMLGPIARREMDGGVHMAVWPVLRRKEAVYLCRGVKGQGDVKVMGGWELNWRVLSRPD